MKKLVDMDLAAAEERVLSAQHQSRIRRLKDPKTPLQFAREMIQAHITFYGRPDVNSAREEILENVRAEAGQGREDRTEYWVEVLGHVDRLDMEHRVPKDLRGD